MASKKLRSVNTHFWDDNYVINLDPIEKLIYLYLITNPLCNLIGIYEISLRRIAFDTGIDKDMVAKILKRYEDDGKVKYVEGYIIIHNFVKNQNYNTNMTKGAKHLFDLLPETIRNHSKGFETVRKEEYEYEVEEEVEKEEREGPNFPPPPAEVVKIFQEHGYEQEADKFFDYYDSRGWTTSNGKKATKLKPLIRNWINKIRTHDKSTPIPNKSPEKIKELAQQNFKKKNAAVIASRCVVGDQVNLTEFIKTLTHGQNGLSSDHIFRDETERLAISFLASKNLKYI